MGDEAIYGWETGIKLDNYQGDVILYSKTPVAKFTTWLEYGERCWKCIDVKNS